MGDSNRLGQIPLGGNLGSAFRTPDPPAQWNHIYLPGAWYAPGMMGQGNAPSGTQGVLAYSSPTGSIRWAVPHFFGVAGQITDIASYMNGNGGATNKAWFAIYRSNSSKTAPAGRIFSVEHVVANFANTKTESNNLALSVDAGELIWFVSNTNQPTCLGIVPINLAPMLGTNFDGTGGANPLRAYQVGYRIPEAYAQPPVNWTGTTKWLSSDDVGGGNIGAAICLFKFATS